MSMKKIAVAAGLAGTLSGCMFYDNGREVVVGPVPPAPVVVAPAVVAPAPVVATPAVVAPAPAVVMPAYSPWRWYGPYWWGPRFHHHHGRWR